MGEVIIPLGHNARLYYGKAGEPITPGQLNFVPGVRDLTVGLDKDDADATRRRCWGWEDARESVKRLRLTFDVVNVVDECVAYETKAIAALRTAFWTGYYQGSTGIALMAAAAVIPGGTKKQTKMYSMVEADYLIVKFERAEPQLDIQVFNVEARMTLIHCYGHELHRPMWWPIG